MRDGKGRQARHLQRYDGISSGQEHKGREARHLQRQVGVRAGQKHKYDFTTFFFSNFPNGFGEMDMHKVFQRWARVKEVFISRKLNKWGRRFGFVRFFEVRHVGKLEKESDQIYIGNMKLHVNIPRYRRLESEPRREQRKGEKTPFLESQGGPGRWGQADGPVGKGRAIRKEIWVEKRGKKSYAEIVKGDNQQKRKDPVIATHKQILPWMENSVIG